MKELRLNIALNIVLNIRVEKTIMKVRRKIVQEYLELSIILIHKTFNTQSLLKIKGDIPLVAYIDF